MNDDFEEQKGLLLEYWHLLYRLHEDKENYEPAFWRSSRRRTLDSIAHLENLLNCNSEYQELHDDLVLILHPRD
jgi:hypothetical protein